MSLPFRIGQGFDIHAFTDGRPLILGGVTVPHPRGLAGHSDADVLTHTVIDAILGAAGLGDLGGVFGVDRPEYRDASSLELLAHALELAAEKGWVPAQVDATVVAEAPKLAPHRAAMTAALAGALGLDPGRVSIKAATAEGLGFVGRKEGIAALAVVLLAPRGESAS